MTDWIMRAAGIVFRPDREWQIISEERRTGWALCMRYLLPLAAVGPLAYHAGFLLRSGYPSDAIEREILAQSLIIFPLTGWLVCVLAITIVGTVTYILAPIFSGRRMFTQALTVAVYAAMPVCLACLVLLAPISRFPLLAIIIMIGAIHGCSVFYLGVHYMLGVPFSQSAECAGIVLAGSAMISTTLGYAAGAAGLFPLI
jgi:hypothetical protein